MMLLRLRIVLGVLFVGVAANEVVTVLIERETRPVAPEVESGPGGPDEMPGGERPLASEPATGPIGPSSARSGAADPQPESREDDPWEGSTDSGRTWVVGSGATRQHESPSAGEDSTGEAIGSPSTGSGSGPTLPDPFTLSGGSDGLARDAEPAPDDVPDPVQDTPAADEPEEPGVDVVPPAPAASPRPERPLVPSSPRIRPPGPEIESVSPSFGPTPGGTEVTIRGRRFDRWGTLVRIGSTPLTAVVVRSTTEITGRTPPGRIGWASVTVETPDGQATLERGFRYQEPGPDVTGDGIPDLVVSEMTLSQVKIFPGRRGGLPTETPILLSGENTTSSFGVSVALGDVTGDGIADVIVGAWRYGYQYVGRVYVFRGGALLGSRNASSAEVKLTGIDASGSFGGKLAVGDISGDGTADVIVSAPWHRVSGRRKGMIYAWFGGRRLRSSGANMADLRFEAEPDGREFGASVLAKDLSGDGIPDLIAGDHYIDLVRGRVYVFYGGPTLVGQSASTADAILTGDDTSIRFGEDLAVGDLDGDGAPDLAVGSANGPIGRAFVFLGSGRGFRSRRVAQADATFLGEEWAWSTFGYDVEIGDLDDDGRDDLAVTGHGWNRDGRGNRMGRVYVFLSVGRPVDRLAAEADVTLTGTVGSGQFGREIAIGWLDDDPIPDLLVSGQVSGFYGFRGGAGLASGPSTSAAYVLPTLRCTDNGIGR